MEKNPELVVGRGMICFIRCNLFYIAIASILWIFIFTGNVALGDGDSIDLGLSAEHFKEGEVPEGWRLKRTKGYKTSRVSAVWASEDGAVGVKLQSNGALTFLQKTVSIDIKDYPIVTWRWRVDNVLEGNDERSKKGDDHPIRIFFVFEPDVKKQSAGFRVKRFLFLDRIHGHPIGGRFTEYLWSSYLDPGEIINDPSKPKQKLMVVEGGGENLGKWIEYERNLYDDFKSFYGEEPRRLIFIGVLNDTDQTGQRASSFIADLKLHKIYEAYKPGSCCS